MFAPTMAIPRFGHRRAPWTSKIVIATSHFAILFAFAVAGTLFLGFAIASPIVVPLAARQGVALSSMDLSTAHQLGSYWWLFAAGGIVSFGGALATLGKMMERLSAPKTA